MKSWPPPEWGLLLDAVTSTAHPRADWSEFRTTDWRLVLRAAHWHRLTPLLYRHLVDDPEIPAPVLHELEDAYLGNVARNLLVSQTLTQVLAALRDVDVPAMPLKGAALIKAIYPEPGVRELLDLDVLVPAGQIAAATQALRRLAFGPTRAEDAPDHHAPALTAPDARTAVELHHHVALASEAHYFKIDGFWRRAGLVEEEPPWLLATREDLLLHVALHFTRNRLAGRTAGALAQIGDIAWITKDDGIDWDTFTKRVRGYAIETEIFLALWCAAELGVTLPARALRALRPTSFERTIGRRFLMLRVLRSDERQLVRSLRRAVLPERETLVVGWRAGGDDWPALARAYIRRARVRVPDVGAALGQPLRQIRDYRLNGQIAALGRDERSR